MYEAYWNLAEKPFMNTPDSRFLYFSRQHEESLTRMLYAITEDKGAMLLTGDYGCGKTLLSRTLLERLDPARYDMALLPHPNLSAVEFLQEILYQFGYESPRTENKAELLHLLNDCLLANHARGRSTLILVDEAQMVIDKSTLEEIRLLLNFQRNRRFFLTLILMGQPEFMKTLEALPQLLQRLSVRYHLSALSPEDTHAYLRRRLEIAGSRQEIFTSRAEDRIVEVSKGVPRSVNNVADMALMVGFGQKAPVVDEEIVRQVIDDMNA
ncbi:MAG: AAA family ATPase [Planctomycetota bacterium]